MRAPAALLVILLVSGASSALVTDDILDGVSSVADDPGSVLGPGAGEAPGDTPAQPPEGGSGPGFAEAVAAAFRDEMVMVSAAGLLAASLGVAGFALVTRYISPREALKNPQRAMLYGFIRASPGAHLKQLSEEFGMKSSSILWHIRKLESADLVSSERANGYRVFYPVEGGVELKRVSRGLTALQNANARRILEHLERNPGSTAPQVGRRTGINAGTVRWHLRKMREFGLLEDVVSDEAARHYPTPLGLRTLETFQGRPAGDERTQVRISPVPHPEGG